ncbi:hypothetical protein HMPREF3224_01322 [Anaerococcus hydrogenalis]|nr:hypothetical protein HMPREF3224_01322 [Anaerococcus hydrogenalis]
MYKSEDKLVYKLNFKKIKLWPVDCVEKWITYKNLSKTYHLRF